MKLYDVMNGSYVRVIEQIPDEGKSTTQEVQVPIGSPSVSAGELIFFHHIDGMYSLCNKVNEDTKKLEEVCHLVAWADVEVIDLNDIHPFEVIRTLIGRSGYGKDGQGEFRSAQLCEMGDDWVKNAIIYVGESHPHCQYYKQELEYRKKNGISIPDTEE
jgi:hypothetical protein